MVYNIKEERRKELTKQRVAYAKQQRQIRNSTRPFIAWDGEGRESCGSDEPCGQIYNEGRNTEFRNHKPDCHKYVLLMYSRGEKADRLVDMDGISTKKALRFICDVADSFPGAIHVIYGGSYDVNMILKDLRPEKVLMLVKKKTILYDDYRIEYVPRKYFRIQRRERLPYVPWNKRPVVTDVTIYDAIGFFQGSFVKNLEECLPDSKEFDIEKIKEGKKRRGTFTEADIEGFVVPYTREELKGLIALMNYLRKCFLGADMHLRRWDGSGAAASSVLRDQNVKRLYWNEEIQGPIPQGAEMAMRIAYGGGRSEMLKCGYTKKKVYRKDIISAYPSIMPLLPALYGGMWLNFTDSQSVNMLTPWSVYRIYWDYEHRYNNRGDRIGFDEENILYPFFYRQPWREPTVFYPQRGYSWVWEPELRAALKWSHKLRGKIHVFEKWQFFPNPYITDRPFSFVPEMFEKRQEYKRAGNGAQLAYKLVINTLYGKTAQTKGYHFDKLGRIKTPPYYSLFYAGNITSHIRAKIFDACMQHPESIIAIATDGLWSLKDLDVDEGTGLGQWESEILTDFTSIQAGIYFATKSDGKEIYHYRGFNQGSINKYDVWEAWENLHPYLSIPTKRFVTMGSAVASQERFDEFWRVWDNSPRLLSIVPNAPASKRISNEARDEYWRYAFELLPLVAQSPDWFTHNVHSEDDLTDEFMSKPHPLPWLEREISEEEEEGDRQREESMDLAEQDDIGYDD